MEHLQPSSLGSLDAHLDFARYRAHVLKQIRQFFESRDVLEVLTPPARSEAIVDTHIDLYQVKDLGYFQSSPELSMKELLCQGFPSIYQIAPVARKGEIGKWHKPQFSLLEWYRLGWNEEQLIQELLEFTQVILPGGDVLEITYQDLFENTVNLNPIHSSLSAILEKIMELGLPTPPESDRIFLLDYLLSLYIIPSLKGDLWVVIKNYPLEQRALGTVSIQDPHCSTRFELFYRGVELANGWKEERDVSVLKGIFEQEISKRQLAGKEALPFPKSFLACMETGLPNCAGVALGLDRLLKLGWERMNPELSS